MPPSITVDTKEFLKALRSLGRMPKAHKDERCLTLEKKGSELILSTGIATTRILAKGRWKLNASISYKAMEVLIDVVKRRDSGVPLEIQKSKDFLRIEKVKISCAYGAVEASTEKVQESEKVKQRVKPPDDQDKQRYVYGEPSKDRVLAEIKQLFPDAYLIPPYRIMVVAFESMEGLIVRLTPLNAEFRLLPHPLPEDKAEWFAKSEVWKTLRFFELVKLGTREVILTANKVASALVDRQRRNPYTPE